MAIAQYNIAIIPPDYIRKQAIEVSRSLIAHETFFVLDDTTFYTHATLHAVDLNKKDLPRAQGIVSAILGETPSFHLEPIGYVYYPGDWIAIEYHRNETIDTLHERLVKALNPLRQPRHSREEIEAREDLSDVDKANIIDYGHRMLLTQFEPHITFTRLKVTNEGVEQTLPDLSWSFQAADIGIFLSAAHGACVERIETYTLR